MSFEESNNISSVLMQLNIPTVLAFDIDLYLSYIDLQCVRLDQK